MKSDYQDWAEFHQKANQILERKILGVHPILQLVAKTSFDNNFRIDLVRSEQNIYSLEKLVWKKKYDFSKLNNPLEKVKLFGQYTPTMERESIILNPNSRLTLLNLIEQLVSNEKEYIVTEKPIVLDGVQHDLWVQYLGKEIHTAWNVMPQYWKTIPVLKNLLFDLSRSRYDDE